MSDIADIFGDIVKKTTDLTLENITLHKKLDIAIKALEEIKRYRGGAIAVDNLGHERDLPNFEGDIALTALNKIDEINKSL